MTTPMTMPMPPADHIDAARAFELEANAAFAAGKMLLAAEMLWGAAAHAIIAVAQQRGWPYERHRDLTTTAKRLAFESDDWRIWDGAKAAGQCHIYFYHRVMYDGFTLQSARRLVSDLVARLLALIL